MHYFIRLNYEKPISIQAEKLLSIQSNPIKNFGLMDY